MHVAVETRPEVQVFNPFTEPVNWEGLGAFTSLWTDASTSNNKCAALHSVNTSAIPVSVIRLRAKIFSSREREYGGDSREGAEGGGLAAIIIEEVKKW